MSGESDTPDTAEVPIAMEFLLKALLLFPEARESVPEAVLLKPRAVAFKPEAVLLKPRAVAPKPVELLPCPAAKELAPVAELRRPNDTELSPVAWDSSPIAMLLLVAIAPEGPPMAIEKVSAEVFPTGAVLMVPP